MSQENWEGYLNMVGDNLDSMPVLSDSVDQEWEWQQERLGKITGSKIGKLIVKSRDKKSYILSTGETAKKLIYKIAWERFLTSDSNGLNRLNVSSKEMEHGNTFEEQAIEKYEERTKRTVNRTPYDFRKYNDFFGGTPDGFIGDCGLVEIKCPWNGGLHILSLIEKEVYNKEYYFQMQSYMLITGRDWCDFVTYDPDLPEGLNLSITTIDRDEEVIKAIKSIVDEVIDKVKEIVKELEDRV